MTNNEQGPRISMQDICFYRQYNIQVFFVTLCNNIKGSNFAIMETTRDRLVNEAKTALHHITFFLAI